MKTHNTFLFRQYILRQLCRIDITKIREFHKCSSLQILGRRDGGREGKFNFTVLSNLPFSPFIQQWESSLVKFVISKKKYTACISSELIAQNCLCDFEKTTATPDDLYYQLYVQFHEQALLKVSTPIMCFEICLGKCFIGTLMGQETGRKSQETILTV